MNHKLESLPLSRKDQVSFCILRSSHQPDKKYWLHNIGRALDTVCQKCGIGKETVEHAMEECPQTVHHPATQLPELYLIATNSHKALELWERWKAKPDLPGSLQPGQPTKVVGAAACSKTTTITAARLRKHYLRGAMGEVSGPRTVFDHNQLY